MRKDLELFVRGAFALGLRRRPQAFTADEPIDLNPGPLKIDELELHNTKPRGRTHSTYTGPVRHKPTIVARAAVSGEWC